MESESIWHSWSQPGAYRVTLTVRDGYLTGDVQSTTIEISLYPSSPSFLPRALLTQTRLRRGMQSKYFANFYDPDIESGVEAWLDKDAFVDSDLDGLDWNDRQ